MQLDLIHHRAHAGGGLDAFQVFRQEVGHADLAHLAVLLGCDERLPRLDVTIDAGIGPMDQHEIEHTDAESQAALLDGYESLLVFVVAAGELGSDDQLVVVDGGTGRAEANSTFVFIVECGVDQSIAGVDARFDGESARQPPQVIGA